MRFDIQPFKDADAAREWARKRIDAAAGKARARHITVTEGQDVTYQAKYFDAQAFRRAGYPEKDLEQYPWVFREAEALSVSGRSAADDILRAGDPWNAVIGPNIEGQRIGGKRSLDKLKTVAEIVSHTSGILKRLSAV